MARAPPMSSTDAATQTVTGTASDETGVVEVRVNGILATSSDGFATWQVVDIPLVAGLNTLTASAVDTLGIADLEAATVIVDAGGGPPVAAITFSFSFPYALPDFGSAPGDRSSSRFLTRAVNATKFPTLIDEEPVFHWQ